VVVGDGAVGKTCMLMSYTTNSFPKDYVPTIFENYTATVEVDGITNSLSLFDTAGQEGYARLRPLSYDLTNVFLVCFAVNSKSSFANVENKWIPELNEHAPGVPFLLIGTKSDMRNEPKDMGLASSAEQTSDMKNFSEDLESALPEEQKPEPTDMVSRLSAEKMAQKLGAAGYFECSALEPDSLRVLFDEAIRVASKKTEEPDGCCGLL